MKIDIECYNGLGNGFSLHDSKGDTLKGFYTKLQFSNLSKQDPILKVTMYTYNDVLDLDGDNSFTEEVLAEFPAIERVKPV